MTMNAIQNARFVVVLAAAVFVNAVVIYGHKDFCIVCMLVQMGGQFVGIKTLYLFMYDRP